MKINNNYLKEKLKHVYWLNGGPCAGKTTMTKKFVNELGFQTLKDDVLKYRSFSNSEIHSALQKPNQNLDWDKWFNKPVDLHLQWLVDFAREMMEFFVVDLLKMPDDRPVIVDLGVMPEDILPFISKNNIIGLFTSKKEIENLYFYRDDHKMILECIENNTENPQQTIKHSNKSMVKFSNKIKKACIKNEIKILERTTEMSVEQQFELICKHFGF